MLMGVLSVCGPVYHECAVPMEAGTESCWEGVTDGY